MIDVIYVCSCTYAYDWFTLGYDTEYAFMKCFNLNKKLR